MVPWCGVGPRAYHQAIGCRVIRQERNGGGPVLIEPVDGNGFRITGAGGLSVGLTAEGATVAEAMDRLAARVRQRVDAVAKLADLDVSEIPAPWQQDAGYLRDD